MKVKKLIMPLLLLISCLFSFTACADEKLQFQFDVNSSVELVYSCADENKNFNFELDKESAKIVVEELNKITYTEVKEHIDFGPSYDCLRIIIGSDNLDLYNAGYAISKGGYITYNGKLSKTSDNFVFLLDYVNIE